MLQELFLSGGLSIACRWRNVCVVSPSYFPAKDMHDVTGVTETSMTDECLPGVPTENICFTPLHIALLSGPDCAAHLSIVVTNVFLRM